MSNNKEIIQNLGDNLLRSQLAEKLKVLVLQTKQEANDLIKYPSRPKIRLKRLANPYFIRAFQIHWFLRVWHLKRCFKMNHLVKTFLRIQILRRFITSETKERITFCLNLMMFRLKILLRPSWPNESKNEKMILSSQHHTLIYHSLQAKYLLTLQKLMIIHETSQSMVMIIQWCVD